MARKPQTPLERFQVLALWQWGLLVIVVGVLAGALTPMVMPEAAGEAARRGQQFGQSVATIFFVIVGVVLIALHFVLPRKRKKGR